MGRSDMPATKLSISLSTVQLAAVDAIAGRLGRSRSGWIQDVIRGALARAGEEEDAVILAQDVLRSRKVGQDPVARELAQVILRLTVRR